MRKAIISLVVAATALVPAALLADGMPPQARKPGQAASTPPSGSVATATGPVTMADLAPDAPSEYTVVKGDTLWGIAGKFLKDPWKWPQIWQMNQDQIKDPHWIYPGDVIRLDRSGQYPSLSMGGAGGASGGSAAQAAANVVRVEPRIRVETLATAVPSIPSSAIGPFLSQPLVVEAGGLDNAPSIVATEEGRVVLSAGDLAYVDRLGSSAPLNWQVFRAGVPMRDPESGEVLGYEAKYVGDARVRRFGNPSTLEITKARQEINRGDLLTPARETAYPTFIPRAPSKLVRGVIMGVDGGVTEFGQFAIVTLNRGARDGLEVGHVLASYRRGAIAGAPGIRGDSTFIDMRGWVSNLGLGRVFGDMDVKPNPVVPEPPRPATPADPTVGVAHTGGAVRLPDERNGLIFVFRVFEKMSYGMVMRANRPIHVGDVIQTP
jgi:hypothetical protein